MRPFVPDVITDQLNLVVALVLGIGFGFVLEQAGFSSSRKLAGVFYGYDFTVLRVFFTAAITAMSGVLLLGYFGMLDTEAIFVNPTWLLPAIIGGAIMGVGFVIGGYCPGTSVCAAAIGKVDAMFFVGGGLLGVFVFGESYPFTKVFYESTALGPIKVFDSLGLSQGLFAFILIVVAVGAFIVTSKIERKVSKTPPDVQNVRKWNHVFAGTGIIALGVVFIFMPDRKASLIEKTSDASFIESHSVQIMDADELAFRIMDHEPNIRIIDIRLPEVYAKLALPGSMNIPLREFFGKDWAELLSQRHVKKVLVGNNETQERAACLLLQEIGYENVAALQGGFDAFRKTILSTTVFVPTGSRWDEAVRRFREEARVDILKMIEDGKNKQPKEVKREKKIQGGC